MSHIKILIHVVWNTKNRQPLLQREKREILFEHIKASAHEKGIQLDTLGGYADHVHCLINLAAVQSVAKVVQLLKGESSYWTNKNNLIFPKLEWAEDYYAVSVNQTGIEAVRHYISTLY